MACAIICLKDETAAYALNYETGCTVYVLFDGVVNHLSNSFVMNGCVI